MPTPRKALLLGDARLTRLMYKMPERCATITEYATATGLTTQRVTELLGEALDTGTVALEPVGGEVFLHTAPDGRPGPLHLPEVRPNLWERLRSHGSTHYAHSLWALLRSLEFAGWRVEANPERIGANLGRLQPPPQLAIYVDHILAPLALHPDPATTASPAGPVAALSAAGADVIGVVVPSGALDDTITALRMLHLSSPGVSPTLVLEAPSYQPVAVTSRDAAIPTTGTGTFTVVVVDNP